MANKNKNSIKLTEAMKIDIVRLAHLGLTQKQIMEEIHCSQYAVAKYSKGINPPHRISDETKEEIIRMLVQTDMSQREIAKVIGVTGRSVSYISQRLGLRPSRRNSRNFAQNRQVPTRDKDAQRYEVFLYNATALPRLEYSTVLDHMPTYWDLINACREMGLTNAEDFETEESSSSRDKICYGSVYNRKMNPIASFAIERIKGDAKDLDGFFDGMDKSYYE